MKIIVVGCGKTGRTIVASLVKEHHDVTCIDINANVVADLRDAYDVIALVGSGTDYENLKEVDAGKAELFIAVTGSDELNMLSCFAAKRMGAQHTVARIRDLENNDSSLGFMKRELELSLVINPERMAAEAVYNILRLPSASNVEIFPRSRFEMIEIQLKADSPLDGVMLADLRKRSKEKFLICAVERGSETIIPSGSFVLRSKDKVGIIATRKDAPRVLATLGVENISVKSVILLGAGTVSLYLAKMLLDGKHSVKLIDQDRAVCEEVCELLPDAATVIHGNGMMQDLLMEEGITDTDAFVALTGRDEDNILISVYATRQNVPKVVTKINNRDLATLAESIGIESIVTPRKIVADLIVKYARALENSMGSQIETLYSIMDDHAEALDFIVLDDFEYTGIPLKDLKFHPNVLIAGITRDRDTFIPTGNDVILTGDHVIVIAEGKRILSLSDIIAG